MDRPHPDRPHPDRRGLDRRGLDRHGPGRHGLARTPADAGYTLLEILIVLAITAIALAIAVPTLSSGRSQLSLRHAEAQLLAYLREARIEAIAANRDIHVHVDLSARSVASDKLGSTQLGDDDLRIDFTTARSLVTDERRGDLVFFADGSSTGGRFVLAVGTAARVVDVDWITGLARPHDG